MAEDTSLDGVTTTRIDKRRSTNKEMSNTQTVKIHEPGRSPEHGDYKSPQHSPKENGDTHAKSKTPSPTPMDLAADFFSEEEPSEKLKKSKGVSSKETGEEKETNDDGADDDSNDVLDEGRVLRKRQPRLRRVQFDSDEDDGVESGVNSRNSPNVKTNLEPYETTDTLSVPPEEYLKEFSALSNNEYLFKKERKKGDRVLECECFYDPADPNSACGDGCLNRMIFMECDPTTCPCRKRCRNQVFQRGTNVKVEVFLCGKKGRGLRTLEPIHKGQFVIEYVGEVMRPSDFQKRVNKYEEKGHKHFYFMNLDRNETIDATKKGSVSRFINHSCAPNMVTQKWQVAGDMRVGLFALRDIAPGEELSFDYQFERYGDKAQACYCGAPTCRGSIASSTKKVVSLAEDVHEPPELRLAEELKGLVGKDGGLGKDRECVRSFVSLMVNAETWDERSLCLDVIEKSSEEALQIFVKLRGLRMCRLSLLFSMATRNVLAEASNGAEEEVGESECEDSASTRTHRILSIMQHLPVSSRNQVEQADVESIVQKCAEGKDLEIAQVAKDLLDGWNALEREFKIPKIPKRKPAASEEPKRDERETKRPRSASPPSLYQRMFMTNRWEDGGSRASNTERRDDRTQSQGTTSPPTSALSPLSSSSSTHPDGKPVPSLSATPRSRSRSPSPGAKNETSHGSNRDSNREKPSETNSKTPKETFSGTAHVAGQPLLPMPSPTPNMAHYAVGTPIGFGGVRPPIPHQAGQPFMNLPFQGFLQQPTIMLRQNSEGAGAGGNNAPAAQNATADLAAGNYVYAPWVSYAQSNPQAYAYAAQLNAASQNSQNPTAGETKITDTTVSSGNGGGNTSASTTQRGAAEKKKAANGTEIPVKMNDPDLAPGWVAWFVRGKPFYQNLVTKKTTWHRPPPPEPTQPPSVPLAQPPVPAANTNLSSETKKETPTSEKITATTDSGAGNGARVVPTDSSKSKQNVRPHAQTLAEKEAFMKQVAEVVRKNLSRYRDEKCPKGRITCNEDFKYVARKITHIVVEKHKKAHSDYVFKESTAKHVRKFLMDFMGRQGPVYVRKTRETRSPSPSD